MSRARLGRIASLIAVAAGVILLVLPLRAAAQPAPNGREAHLVIVDDATMEDLLSVPGFRSLAQQGGAGLLSDALPLRDIEPYLVPNASGPPLSPISPVDGLAYEDQGTLASGGTFSSRKAQAVAAGLQASLEASSADEALVIVASATPAAADEAAGDELSGIVLASGHPADLAAAMASKSGREAGSLTSDSTRRDGVVTTRDIATTILTYLDQPSADGDPMGSVIRPIEGPPPYELHDRYLAQRRMYVPIGTAAALSVTLAGLLGIVFVWLGRRVPARARRFVGWWCLSVPALATGLLAAGHLPQLSYAAVVPFVAIVTVLGTMAISPLERRSVVLVPAGLGAAVLVFFALEAALSWTAALTPFLGGSELDGGRFYGSPNVLIGLLAGSALYVAQRLRTGIGVALLVVVALVAGLPYLGTNLGGGVTVFASAGLWLALRERTRLGTWKAVAAFVGVAVGGTVVLLTVHALSPLQTHVSRFEEHAGGLGGVLGTFADRLQVGFDLISRNPAALIPVIGLPLVLFAILRPPDPIRVTFDAWPAWRDAVLAIVLTGIVAYLANDSGPAAAGLAFGLGLGGMLGVSLLAGAGKMGGS